MGRTRKLTDEEREVIYKERLRCNYQKAKNKRNENPEKKEAYNKYQREYQKNRREMLKTFLDEK